MVADCSDNGLSSSEGLRGRGGGVQAFGALPPNTSLVGWGSVGRLRVCKRGGREGERGATFHQQHMNLDREQEQSGAPYGRASPDQSNLLPALTVDTSVNIFLYIYYNLFVIYFILLDGEKRHIGLPVCTTHTDNKVDFDYGSDYGSFCLSVCLSVCGSVCGSACGSVCISVCLSVCGSVCLPSHWLLTWHRAVTRLRVFPPVCLPATSPCVVARLCQPHTLIPGTGCLSALASLAVSLSLGLPAKLGH